MKVTTKVLLVSKATVLSALVLLSACQKTPEMQGNSFQTSATDALAGFTKKVSDPQKSRFAIASGQRGVRASYGGGYGGGYGGSGDMFDLGFTPGWNGFSGVPYENTYMHSNIESELRRCLQLVRAIPRRAENYEIMVSALSRCVTVAVAYRNPVYTLGYQGMDTWGQAFWRYNLDSSRYGYFGQYNGWYSQYHPYAQNGFLESDLNY